MDFYTNTFMDLLCLESAMSNPSFDIDDNDDFLTDDETAQESIYGFGYGLFEASVATEASLEPAFEGVGASIIDAIKRFFAAIANFFKNLFTKNKQQEAKFTKDCQQAKSTNLSNVDKILSSINPIINEIIDKLVSLINTMHNNISSVDKVGLTSIIQRINTGLNAAKSSGKDNTGQYNEFVRSYKNSNQSMSKDSVELEKILKDADSKYKASEEAYDATMKFCTGKLESLANSIMDAAEKAEIDITRDMSEEDEKKLENGIVKNAAKEYNTKLKKAFNASSIVKLKAMSNDKFINSVKSEFETILSLCSKNADYCKKMSAIADTISKNKQLNDKQRNTASAVYKLCQGYLSVSKFIGKFSQLTDIYKMISFSKAMKMASETL